MLLSKLRVRHIGIAAAWTAVLYLTLPATAWNATGHRVIAAIAYERLTPAARARVDALLKSHPDYATILRADTPATPPFRPSSVGPLAEALARAAFLAAAVWPDTIRGDPRFYDDLRKDTQPTPLLPGFPEMARHTNWHYYDVPYSADGTPPKEAGVPNALTEIRRLMRELGDTSESPSRQSYDLPWIEHIVGDLHQPLHCVSRFLKSQPDGDAGGNFVFVSPGGNLHAFWDGLTGTDTTDAYVTQYAAEIIAEHPAPDDLQRNPELGSDPEAWIEEGVRAAHTSVYTFGMGTGSRENPIRLSVHYQDDAKRIARARIALAGYRLAAVLNAALK